MANFATDSRRAQWETTRSIDSATFTGAYQPLGLPLTQPGAIVVFVNNSAVPVSVSDDGVNEKDYIRAGESRVYHMGAAAQTSVNSERMALAGGSQIYVLGTASTGLFKLVVIFQGI